MALSFKVKAISRSKFLKNLFLSIIFLLSFLLIFFSKSDYFVVNKFKSISNNYLHPITSFIVAPIKVVSQIQNKFYEFRNKRDEAITKTANLELEKRVFIQTIDFLWRSHLQYLEHLRQVVGLRGYAQKDPLEEFRREAFKLFEDLLHKIKVDFITFLNNLEVADKENYLQNEDDKPKKKIIEIPRKMKRNEPCYCGSGKKYKHCCGAL